MVPTWRWLCLICFHALTNTIHLFSLWDVRRTKLWSFSHCQPEKGDRLISDKKFRVASKRPWDHHLQILRLSTICRFLSEKSYNTAFSWGSKVLLMILSPLYDDDDDDDDDDADDDDDDDAFAALFPGTMFFSSQVRWINCTHFRQNSAKVASILDVDARHPRSWLPWVLLAQAWSSTLAL